MTIGTLAVAVASCALLVPGAASANIYRVEIEIVTGATPHLRADVMWASAQDGQGVFLWPNNNSASQEFDLIDMGLVTYTSGRTRRFFQIRARHSGKCLMLDRSQPNVANGRRIAQYACTPPSYKSAQWSFDDMNGPCEDTVGVPVPDAHTGGIRSAGWLRPAQCVDRGWRVIRNRWYINTCLDTANPSGKRPGQKAVVQLWTCISSPKAWNADNQIWKVINPLNGRPITNLR